MCIQAMRRELARLTVDVTSSQEFVMLYKKQRQQLERSGSQANDDICILRPNLVTTQANIDILYRPFSLYIYRSLFELSLKRMSCS